MEENIQHKSLTEHIRFDLFPWQEYTNLDSRIYVIKLDKLEKCRAKSGPSTCALNPETSCCSSTVLNRNSL